MTMKIPLFLKYIEMIVTHPHSFFTTAKPSIRQSVEHVAGFVFLGMILNILVILPGAAYAKAALPAWKYGLYMASILLLVIIMTAVVVLMVVSVYLISHVIIKLFSGKQRFSQTAQLMYALTPVLLVGLIPQFSILKQISMIAGTVAILDALYIHFVGMKILHKMGTENAAIALLFMAAVAYGAIMIGMSMIGGI